MKNRTSPDLITSLKYNEIFVFGSNESGIHGGGAAFLARNRFGAKDGVGFGLQGRSFALPTKSWGIRGTLPLYVIQNYVDRFIDFAKVHTEYIFLVTEVGCGLAGLSVSKVAPLFRKAMRVRNIYLPRRFWEVLKPINKEKILLDTLKALRFDARDVLQGGYGKPTKVKIFLINNALKKYKQR